jgi:hypothetical protein
MCEYSYYLHSYRYRIMSDLDYEQLNCIYEYIFRYLNTNIIQQVELNVQRV